MPDDKLTITILTTSFYAKEEEISKSAKFFEESGFNVRVKTRGIDRKKEPQEFAKYDLPPVFQKIKKQYFDATPGSDEGQTQKAFEQDYLDYSAVFVEDKKGINFPEEVDSKKKSQALERLGQKAFSKLSDEKKASLSNNEFDSLTDEEKAKLGKGEFERLGKKEFSPLNNYLEDSYQKSKILYEEIEAASRGEVDVIWPVDGGSGAPEMLQFLPKKLPENPAVVVGMSDVTAVQNALIQSSNYTMKGIQEHGSRVHGYEQYQTDHAQRIYKLFSTIKKARNGEKIEAEYTLKASDKNPRKTEPQLVNLSGGTLNVINRASDSPWQLSQDQNSDTVIVEMHGQAQPLAKSLSQKGDGQEPDKFQKVFGNKKNIFVGNVLFGKESDEYRQFTDRAAAEKINVYEGLKFGHGGDQFPWEPIPLNVPSVLLPGKSDGEATLLVNPSKERLQAKLEEIGYKTNPAQFVETLNKDPEQAGEFISPQIS